MDNSLPTAPAQPTPDPVATPVATAAKKPFRFSSENARALALKGNAKRWAKWKAARDRKASPQGTPDVVAANVEATREPVWQQELDIVEEQIAQARKVLKDMSYRYCEHCERGGVEPQHRAQLMKALDAMLDRKRILLGVPLPGSRRPAPERAPRAGLNLLALPVAVDASDRAEQAG